MIPPVSQGRTSNATAAAPPVTPRLRRRTPRRLSIGLYTYSTLPRGSVVHAAHLADALSAAGHDVTVYALDKDGRGFFRQPRAGVHIRMVPAAPAPASASTADLVALRAGELAAYLDACAPVHDIHHAEDCLTASGLLAARARGARLRLVRTVHHVERFEDPTLLRCQESSIRQADQLLAVSEAARRDVARGFGVPCTVVGNGVDVARFQAPDPGRIAVWRARLGGGPVILAVGGVEERKNSLRLLEAFARLRASRPDARLWILGGATILDHGEYRAAFERARDALPVAVRAAVVELGVVPEDDVPALFRLADVLALPSLHEGFGLAALEALAAGVPVVASRRPPFTEYLDPSCATLVDPLSATAIAAGLATALGLSGSGSGSGSSSSSSSSSSCSCETSSAATARREAGRRRALACSWRRVAERHIAAYERILHARDALPRPLA